MPDDAAQAIAHAIRAAREPRTQEWLGGEVAKVEGRKEAYGQNTVAGWESGKYMIKPAKIFSIERALGLPPGSISRVAGFVPLEAAPARSVEEAIASDNGLSRDQKEDLTAVYQGMVSRTRTRRDQQKSRAGR